MGIGELEAEQRRCSGNETAIGEIAYEDGTDAVRAIFGTARKRANLDYDKAVQELSDRNDKAALAAKWKALGQGHRGLLNELPSTGEQAGRWLRNA